MTPRELRREMRRRRRELRASVKRAKREARARVNELPEVRRERLRRRVRRTLIVVALILLALLLRCDCGPQAPPPVPEVEAPAPEPKPKPPAATGKRKPMLAKVQPQPRAPFEGGARPSPPWLTEFRLQVAARSLRLAECFSGTTGPGALRWSTAVNAKTGAVSDHELEPIGANAELLKEQRDCVINVLSKPAYKLPPELEQQALPERVSMLIEF